VTHPCVTFAPEIGGFGPEIGPFSGRNRPSDRQCGEKPRCLNGLHTPHTLSHDATEVTHHVASVSHRKFAPVPLEFPIFLPAGPAARLRAGVGQLLQSSLGILGAQENSRGPGLPLNRPRIKSDFIPATRFF